jgi:hypothetical protein
MILSQPGWLRRVLLSSGAWRDAVMLLALLAVVVCVTRAYVSEEHWFYYWDQAVHQDIAWNTAQAFGQSWFAGPAFVARSFNNDYNALFAIPLIPFTALLGDSRLVFVTALSVVCLCSFALSCGVLALQLMSGSRRAVFWSGVWAALLVPITWVPTLRGFPDALPASLVVLTLSIVLSERGLRWRRGAALSGALLAMAAILRRHFAYAGLSLFETVALYDLVRVAATRSAGRGRWREEARVTLLWLGVAGTVAAGTLLTVGHGFLRRVVVIDFSVLYKGYENAIAAVLLSFLKPYGWLTLVAAGAGLLLGALARVAARGGVVFLALFAAVSGLQWLLLVRQIGENYTLHFTPVVAAGLVMFAWVLWRGTSGRRRLALVAVGAGWLLTNGILALSTLKIGKDAAWRPLLASQWEPLRRYDYNAILNLARFLAESGPTGARVYVAASSHVINPDIVRHADWVYLGRAFGRLSVLRASEVDTRDEYPVGALIGADMVVTAEPVQYHLPPGEQTTVRVAHDIFAQGVGVARDFTRLPPTFPLLDGVSASVFKRARPTTLDTALETLRIAQEYTPRRPGMQTEWAGVGGSFPSWLHRLPDASTEWIAHPARRGHTPATTLCTVDTLAAVTQVSGEIVFLDPRCSGATLAFFGQTNARGPWPLDEVRRRPDEDGRFALRLDTRGADHVLLELVGYGQTSSIDYCLANVRLATQASHVVCR